MNMVYEREEITVLPKLAKVIRVMTIPPVVVAVLLTVLYFANSIFSTPADYWLTLLFLAVVPVLAYPVQKLVPKWREGGRRTQRNLAFVFSFVGYGGAVLTNALRSAGTEVLYISVVYLASVIILTLFNCLTPWHASGHACSLMGPLLLITLFVGWYAIPVTLAVYAASFWASVYMGRHTPREFWLGSLSSTLATVLCYFILHPTF